MKNLKCIFIVFLILSAAVDVRSNDNPWDKLNEEEQQWVLNKLKDELPNAFTEGPLKDYATIITDLDIVTIATALGEASAGEYDGLMGYMATRGAVYLSEHFKNNLPDGYAKQIYESLEAQSDMLLEIGRAMMNPNKTRADVRDLALQKIKEAVIADLQSKSKEAFMALYDFVLGKGTGELYLMLIQAEIAIINAEGDRIIRDSQNKLFNKYLQGGWDSVKNMDVLGDRRLTFDEAYSMAFRDINQATIKELFDACKKDGGTSFYDWLKNKKNQREIQVLAQQRIKMEKALKKVEDDRKRIHRKAREIWNKALREKLGEEGEEDAKKALDAERSKIIMVLNAYKIILDSDQEFDKIFKQHSEAQKIIKNAKIVERALKGRANLIKEWQLYANSVNELVALFNVFKNTVEPFKKNYDIINAETHNACKSSSKVKAAQDEIEAKLALSGCVEAVRRAREIANAPLTIDINGMENQIILKAHAVLKLKPQTALDEIYSQMKEYMPQFLKAGQALNDCNQAVEDAARLQLEVKRNIRIITKNAGPIIKRLNKYSYYPEVQTAITQLNAVLIGTADKSFFKLEKCNQTFDQDIVNLTQIVFTIDSPEKIAVEAAAVSSIFKYIQSKLSEGEACLASAILIVDRWIKKRKDAKAFVISGQVLQNGKLVKGALVDCRGRLGLTNAAGSFYLSDFKGEYGEEFTITATMLGEAGSAAVTYFGDAIGGVVISLGSKEITFTINGRVIQERKGVDGVTVKCRGVNDVTDASGSFILSGLKSKEDEQFNISASKGNISGGTSVTFRNQSISGILIVLPPPPPEDITIEGAVDNLQGEVKEDLCNNEEIEKNQIILNEAISSANNSYQNFIGNYNLFHSEVNKQVANPAENHLIFKCIRNMELAIGTYPKTLTVINAMITHLIPRIDCSQVTITIADIAGISERTSSNREDMITKIAEVKSVLKQYGADEDNVTENGQSNTDDNEDSEFAGAGGTGEEIAGDSFDQDGDGEQDEGTAMMGENNVGIRIYDSGSAKDDSFYLTVRGQIGGGTTDPGAGQWFYFKLLPGRYEAILNVILAPDDIGTYTIKIFERGNLLKQQRGDPKENAVVIIYFEVKGL